MTPEPRLMANVTRGNIACDDVVIADRPLARMRGLLGRRVLAAGDGLLLQPAPSIHTAFMRFSIDVVFIDRNLQVLKVVEEMPAWHMASARRARSALELAAGEAARRGIKVGDQLVIVNASAQLYTPIATLGDDSNGNGDGAGAGHHRPATTGGADAATRVLVIGGDRRFRSLAALLLTRRGCAVTFADRSGGHMDVAELGATEVVVLDAGSSLTAAARDAARIAALDPPVGVVVVGEEAQDTVMPVLAKWGSFDALYGAIERARPARPAPALEMRGEVLQ